MTKQDKLKEQILLDEFNRGSDYPQKELPDAYRANFIKRAMDTWVKIKQSKSKPKT